MRCILPKWAKTLADILKRGIYGYPIGFSKRLRPRDVCRSSCRSRVGRPAEYVYIMLVPILSLAYAIFLIWLPDRPQPQNKKFHVLHIAAAFAIYVGIARLIQIFVYPMFI